MKKYSSLKKDRKNISAAKTSKTKSNSMKRTPYENNGIKLCVSPKSERTKFVKEMPPFTIVDGKPKQMRRLHKLRLPKESKMVGGKVIKMKFGLTKRQVA